jgi:hypothetical protein
MRPVHVLEHGKLLPVGTVSFVELDGSAYLLTAAHVLDELEGRDWGIALKGDYQTQLEFKKVIPQNNRREDDRWDFAFAMLDDGWRKLGIAPIKLDQLIDSDAISVCVLAGYPASKNRLKMNTIQPEMRSYTTVRVPSADNRYQAIGVEAKTHLMAFFDGKSSFIDGNRVSTFSPLGMSGGLVFGWTESEVAYLKLGIAAPMRPVALVVERKENHGVVLKPSLQTIASEVRRSIE